MPTVLGEGNGPLGTTMGFGTFEIFYGDYEGAWSTEPIPDARLPVAFTEAERMTGSTGLIASVLNGFGDVFGFGDVGDLLLGDPLEGPYGADDYGKVDPKVVARIEKLKARKKALKQAIKHASGAKKNKLEAELKQVKHLLKLAKNTRSSQRSGLSKVATAALGPAGLIASRGGIFRSKKKAARKEAAARHALAKMHHGNAVDDFVSRMQSRTLHPKQRLAWLAAQRRRAALARQRRFVPPGYPPVPGYPSGPSYPFAPPPPPGQVPGTYMVPGGSDLPMMPAGGPGYMNQGPMATTGDDDAMGPGGDEGEDDSKGGLIKVGIGVLVVGGVIYAVTHGKKGRGPKLSKAERRARRAGMGGPP